MEDIELTENGSVWLMFSHRPLSKTEKWILVAIAVGIILCVVAALISAHVF